MAAKAGLTAILLATLLLAPAPAPGGGATAADAVARVDQASYRDLLDNHLYTHAGNNRGYAAVGSTYTPAGQHDAARDNILTWFADLGLQASLDPFTFSSGSATFQGCNNVLGVLPGRINPDRVCFVCGHYDSWQNPGADDNASGVAGVMEAARVLANYPFACTIIFAAWDGEERGLKGSQHWVNTEDVSRVDGVVNLDMIAYNHDADHNGQGDGKAMIYGSPAYRDKWLSAVQRYAPGITPVVYASDLAASDHWYFQTAGRPAGGIIENTYPPVPNPYYHQAADNVDMPGYLDYAYATELVRAAVGLAAEDARLLRPGDTDGNGSVGAADLLVMEGTYGMASGARWIDGDFDADGDVDSLDYLALKANYDGPGTPPASIPEPATILLLAMGGTILRARSFRPGRQTRRRRTPCRTTT
jgi:hypothetical protein